MGFVRNIALIAAAATMAAACDSSVGVEGSAEASVSFAAVGDGGLLGGGSSRPDSTFLIGGHTIVLTSVDLTVSDIELEREDDDDKETMRDGRIVVRVPVDGKVVTPVETRLEAGVYDEIEMTVETARLRGTFDGKPFDITVAINEELEQEIRSAVTIDENGDANITLLLNTEQWFRARNGGAIDLITFSTAGQADLRSNIIASFEALDDDDRDGDDDDDDDDKDNDGYRDND